MNKHPLGQYVIGVIIVLALINLILWFAGRKAILKSTEILSAGFLLGMLAMYIAVHIYRWK
jgi:hypothetical protein